MKEFENAKEVEDLRSLVFINCGAKIDLTSIWFADEASQVNAYVFDSHRPINHNNIISDKKVFLIDDNKTKI